MLALSIRPRTERTVAVLPAVDGKVSVLPLPKYPADPSARQFDDIDDARAFALGLSLTRGWPLHDLTEVRRGA